MSEGIVTKVLDGDDLALAQILTKIENREPGYREIMEELFENTTGSKVIGFTGPPGAGKSTLLNEVVTEYRQQEKTVGVIAVDPSSPYTGGSFLGDRFRQDELKDDPGIFFRSMSVREGSGGLSIATYDAIRALDAFGKDVIFVETVGAGQSEVDVMQAVQTVCLVTFPGAGDDLQANKAGIIEIADVFAVNKSDFDGAESTAQQLRRSLDLGDNDGTDWIPSIEQTIATEGTGISSLVEEIDSHQEHLIEQGKRQEQRRQQLVHESYIRARNRLTKILENTQVDPDPIENPYSGADSIMRSFANSFEGHAIGDDALFLYHR